jgi:hypothetical protein
MNHAPSPHEAPSAAQMAELLAPHRERLRQTVALRLDRRQLARLEGKKNLPGLPRVVRSQEERAALRGAHSPKGRPGEFATLCGEGGEVAESDTQRHKLLFPCPVSRVRQLATGG